MARTQGLLGREAALALAVTILTAPLRCDRWVELAAHDSARTRIRALTCGFAADALTLLLPIQAVVWLSWRPGVSWCLFSKWTYPVASWGLLGVPYVVAVYGLVVAGVTDSGSPVSWSAGSLLGAAKLSGAGEALSFDPDRRLKVVTTEETWSFDVSSGEGLPAPHVEVPAPLEITPSMRKAGVVGRALSPDGRVSVVACTWGIHLEDTASGKRVARLGWGGTLTHQDELRGSEYYNLLSSGRELPILFAPDGRTAFVATRRGPVLELGILPEARLP